MVEVFANSGDADQTPRSAASDLVCPEIQILPLGAPSLLLENTLFKEELVLPESIQEVTKVGGRVSSPHKL